MKKAGFLLLEILVYIILTSIFVLLLFQFSTQTLVNYQTLKFSNPKTHEISIALDLLVKDIQKASKDHFFVKNNQFIIISHQTLEGHNNIGWLLKNQNLYRIQGIYNFSSNAWTNKIESLAASNIKDFVIKVNQSILQNLTIKSPFLKTITISLISSKNNNQIFQKTVYPRAGIIRS